MDDQRAAFSLIINASESNLIRAARRMCRGDEDRAQDLVQDALVRGYEAFLRGAFQPGSNAKAWLLRILANGFINDYNHRKKWESNCDLDTVTDTASVRQEFVQSRENEHPEGALLSNALDEPLAMALGQLQDDFRICVLLVDVEGLEYADVAAALNIPIGTVRSRLSRARLQLHKTLYNYARDRRQV